MIDAYRWRGNGIYVYVTHEKRLFRYQ